MTTPPTSEQAWLGLMNAGKRSFQQGNPGEAAKAYRAATAMMPDRAEGWVNLGSALLESGRHELAAAALQRAVAIKPGLMASHLMLGDALRMLGRLREASASYRHAVSLRRVPISLNKLACALRAENKPELAEDLYREALAMDPGFTLARMNLATVQIELRRYDEAEEQLGALAHLPLPPVERREIENAQLAVAEHRRLDKAITDLVQHNDPAPLEAALRHTPRRIMQTDEGLLASLQRYADAAGRLSNQPVPIDRDLPGEWPLIEAMFMIPLVNSVDEYRAVKAELGNGLKPTAQLLQSINMEPAIRAARGCQLDLQDPVKAELHLRHWHALACHKVPGFEPGHFKSTQNWISDNPTVRRVEPALASATFRHFIRDIYSKLPAGYARAAVVQMAMADLHPFADGNGRVAYTWLNRELEWAGLMPGLFHKKLGLEGELRKARRAVRSSGGDLSAMVAVITRAQHYAREFCAELAAR